MKNKFSGKKIGTILTFILSLILATAFWLAVKISDAEDIHNMPTAFGFDTESASWKI